MALAAVLVAKLRTQAARHSELTEMLSHPEVVADTRRLPALLQERGALEPMVELAARLEALQTRRREAEEILGCASPDPELAELAREELGQLEGEERTLDEEIKNALVTDKDDLRRKVIVEIRAGVGGDEATLFARDLYGIYRKYCESQRWKIEDMDVSTSEIGGFKEVAIDGEGAWARLRFESGGHRVQRVPATEAQGRIHTSAATVAVLPEVEELEIDLRPDDLRIETMRAGGAGGQHVNKTESAVRITHLPTGLVAICMDDRSQIKNRASAMRILRSRVYERELARRAAERSAARKSQVGSGDRSDRIRTYNYPQNRVTDHRLNENYSLEQIVAGKLDPLLGALVNADREERIRNL
jgi:peptide chain release factor 1